MYRLYYYPGNASFAPHLMLQELEVEFELSLVDRKTDAQKSADYLALNPAGRIPTLIDGDLVLFESAAICMYLCEKYPGAGLMPDVGTPERAKFFQWMMYLTNTLQAELMVYFYPEKHTIDPSGAPFIKAAQEKRITEIFELLDTELAGKRYLVGDQLTACDYYLFMPAMWARGFKKPPLSFPNLGAYLRKIALRDAVKQVCKSEDIDLSSYA